MDKLDCGKGQLNFDAHNNRKRLQEQRCRFAITLCSSGRTAWAARQRTLEIYYLLLKVYFSFIIQLNTKQLSRTLVLSEAVQDGINVLETLGDLRLRLCSCEDDFSVYEDEKHHSRLHHPVD